MTPAKLATYVRFKTRTNSVTFPDADIIALAEMRLDELAKNIVTVDENILLTPEFDNLVANQREYALPVDMVSSFKRVEAKLDGINYIKLTEVDLNSNRYTVLNESTITQYYGNGDCQAKFSLARNAITIYSGTITNVTDGLRIWVNTWPSTIVDLTSQVDMAVDPSNTTHGIPRELHEILARGIIIDFKSSREKPIPLVERELTYKTDKLEAINSLKPQNEDREVKGSIPYNDGSQY
jgi:hypothetical protein